MCVDEYLQLLYNLSINFTPLQLLNNTLTPFNITVNVLIPLRWVWCLKPLSTMFQLHRGGGQFYKWRKLEYYKKTTDLPEVTDKLSTMIQLKYCLQ